VLVFAVVNVTTTAQTAGFLSRPTGPRLQRLAGIVIIVMAAPAAAALALDLGAGREAWRWAGLVLFVLFACMSLRVDYMRPVEFRRPPRARILAPYLLLFFGSIVLMGLSLYPVSRPLWAITGVTTAALLAAMVRAQLKGLG
jgi:hypothetical protein